MSGRGDEQHNQNTSVMKSCSEKQIEDLEVADTTLKEVFLTLQRKMLNLEEVGAISLS